ncbi:hypothetical protein MZK49_23500 [Ensifer sesbaniae]|uniref:hypothetical protein n=1 Tax=Ensifer sesbaniae TaxID=1214071 RepID=UPI002000EBD6|nr:hypothetical protein [Ensifer sesbaniae]
MAAILELQGRLLRKAQAGSLPSDGLRNALQRFDLLYNFLMQFQERAIMSAAMGFGGATLGRGDGRDSAVDAPSLRGGVGASQPQRENFAFVPSFVAEPNSGPRKDALLLS